MKNCKPFGAGQLLYTDLVSKDSTIEDYVDSIDREIQNIDPTSNYNTKEIVEVARKFDSSLRRSNLDEYPMVKIRLFGGGANVNEYIGPVDNQPNINYLEMADFLYNSGYTYDEVSNILNNFPETITPNTSADKLAKSYNNFLSRTNGCSIPSGLFGGIFNVFDKVKDAISEIQSGFDLLDAMLKNFQQLIDGGIFDAINNLLQSIIQSVLNKLNSLLEGIFSFFDCIFVGLRQKLNNLTRKTSSLFNELEHLGPNMANMLGIRLGRVAELLSDDALKKFKNQAKDFMDNTINQFEEMNEDIIDMVGYRFTKFMNETQKFLESQIDGYNKVLDNVSRKYRAIEQQSIENTLDAVDSGAIRIDPNELNNLKGKLAKGVNSLNNLFSN